MIIDAALAMLDEAGLPGLNLRALAKRLGVSPMALYGYFEDKDALLDAVAAAALVASLPENRGGEAWDAQLGAALRAMHAVLLAHPGLGELIGRQYVGDQLDPFRERLYAMLEETGWDRQTSFHALRALTSYVVGSALVATRQPRAAKPDPVAFEFGLDLIMKQLRAG
jgi:TetR/AcrR family tetracycline transcriptional repressor